MNKKLLLAVIVLMALFIGSCKELGEGDTTINAVPEQFFTLKPTGTISGKVVDRHTEKPVQGAIASIAFNGSVVNATTDISGSFSFADVPCNRDVTTGIVTGTYQLTVSLVEVNKTIPDSLPKYREYYFNPTLSVAFKDLDDCDSCENRVAVEGLEANIWFDVAKLNTTINGWVVDDKYDAVAGATVWLREAGTGDVLQQTTTDATGKYTFFKVEDGTSVFIHAKSDDWTMEGTGAVMTLVINRTLENLRTQINADRVMITAADNVAPYVVSISPENLQDTSPNNLTIVYRFSEPIKQTAYTVINVPLGLGTLIDDIQFNFMGLKKAASGNTNFKIAWDTTKTLLTVTPAGIVGSAKYQVNIAAALAPGKLTDRAGNNFTANNAVVGDFENLNFTTNGGSTTPLSPSVTRRLNSNIGFSLLNFGGGDVGLEWTLDANARSYRVYRSINGEPYTLLADNVLDTRFTDNPGALVTGYNPPGDREPFSAVTVRYRVHGVSKDLEEGPESNIITVADDVNPRLLDATVDTVSFAGGEYIYLQFDEPLAQTGAQSTANYQSVNSGNGLVSVISEAVYLGFDNISGRYRVRLTVTKDSINPGDVIIATSSASAVTDLAGRPVDSGVNSTTLP